MIGPQISALSGNRVHMNHGPIDLVLWAEGGNSAQAYAQAAQRFDGLLEGLVAELGKLRSPAPHSFQNPIAQAMARAVAPFRPAFITPMAAVAGAVADAVLAAMCDGTNLGRAYVNNGGDIAVHLAAGQSRTAAIAGRGLSKVTLHHNQPARGIATSGRGGRSLSRGIADAVTVVAASAAQADAAATMIANAVDLPGHPAIMRVPACDIQADSDLGHLPATTALGPLRPEEIAKALSNGHAAAKGYAARGLLAGAALFLHSQSQTTGCFSLEKEHAFA